MDEFSPLEQKLGIEFSDKTLLKQAFIHRSYLNEHPEITLPHNERLEFLGDAVLELAVTRFLYLNYPNPEGELTNWRAALVNAKICGEIAESLGFNDFMLLSKGEAKDSGKARHFILANAMESFIGALYLDKGYDDAAEFIGKHVLPQLPSIIEEQRYQDPKSKFQEKAQEVVGVTPTYNVLSESGPDHAKQFVIGVYLNEELISKGEGSSKQEAQEDAAANGLKEKGW